MGGRRLGRRAARAGRHRPRLRAHAVQGHGASAESVRSRRRSRARAARSTPGPPSTRRSTTWSWPAASSTPGSTSSPTRSSTLFDPAELRARAQGRARGDQAGRGQPGARGHADALRHRLHQAPYRRPVIGYDRTVRAVHPRPACSTSSSAGYVANNVTLVVVGDFDGAKAPQQDPARLRRGAPSSRISRAASAAEPQQTRAARDGRRPRETCARRTWRSPSTSRPPPRGHRRARRASAILGPGRLLAAQPVGVKRNRQLVTDVYAYAYTPRDPGLIVARRDLAARSARGRRPRHPRRGVSPRLRGRHARGAPKKRARDHRVRHHLPEGDGAGAGAQARLLRDGRRRPRLRGRVQPRRSRASLPASSARWCGAISPVENSPSRCSCPSREGEGEQARADPQDQPAASGVRGAAARGRAALGAAPRRAGPRPTA